MSEGTLFIVATPIGNLGDLSPRARDVLAAVDLVAAEDTRVAGRLLSHFGIATKLTALHEHNEESKAPSLIEALKSGKSVAIVSDAGTPLVSDPGYRVVRLARDAGLTVSPVPGPSAAVAALSVSGLPTDRFAFEGFLPARKAARRERLGVLRSEVRTLVFFESVHRVAEAVADLADAFGADRAAYIGREISKLHEQCVTASLSELTAMLADGRIPLKGEFVIVTAGATDAAGDDRAAAAAETLLRELIAVLPGRQAVDIVARATGAGRNELYQRMLALKTENS